MTITKFLGTKRPSKAAVTSGNVTTSKRAAKHVPQSGEGATAADLRDELELLMSYASDTVYRLRYDTMQYEYVSPNVARLLGFSTNEMRSMNFRSLIVETRMVTDGLKKVNSFDELEKCRKAGDVGKWQADYLIRTKDGRQIWVSDVSSPWFDESGKIIGSVGSLRDVTDRVEAEEKVREQLQQASREDAITGMHNRSAFFDSLEHEVRRLNRNESEVALLLMDVDHFDQLTKEYGLDGGNAALAQIAEIAKQHLRGTDIPARLGGESFGVILPDTPTDGAYHVAKRIHDAVLRQVFHVNEDNTPVHLAVSIGVAVARSEEPVTVSELFKLADTRMYIAKNTGGDNRVCVDTMHQTH